MKSVSAQSKEDLFKLPHQPEGKYLGFVIASEIAKPDCRAVELEFAKERPFGRQQNPGAGDQLKAGADVAVRYAIV